MVTLKLSKLYNTISANLLTVNIEKNKTKDHQIRRLNQIYQYIKRSYNSLGCNSMLFNSNIVKLEKSVSEIKENNVLLTETS